MLLSRRVNVTLLPVIVCIFIAMAIYTYERYKTTIIQSELTALSYELEGAHNNFYNNLQVMQTTTDMSLSSRSVRNYLQSSSEDSTSLLEVQLTDSFNGLKLPQWQFDRFTIVDDLEQSIYHFDRNDPFSTYQGAGQLSDHFERFYSQVPEHGSTSIAPYSFCLLEESDNDYRVRLYRTFSPGQIISINRFSAPMPLFTAIFEATFNINSLYAEQIQKSFSEFAHLSIMPHSCANQIDNAFSILQSSDEGLALHISSTRELARFDIEVDEEFVQQKLAPYRGTIETTVITGIIFTFMLLRFLIHYQVLAPVLGLTKQVNNAIDGTINELKPSKGRDEIATLNNGYVTLLDRLTIMAKYDNLTGLANRSLFDSQLNAFFSRAQHNHLKGALFFLDLDNFKQVNDTFGHGMGDALLKDFAQKLSTLFRHGEVFSLDESNHSIARLAGDEFAVILNGMPNAESIATAAKRITSLFEKGYQLEGKPLDVHVSIGVAVFPDDADSKESLISKADAAMYQVKRAGKNGYQFYSKELEALAQKHAEIELALNNAMQRNDFYLNFMPIFDCHSQHISGFEVLLRSTCPTLAKYGPAEFIPVAESTGIIKALDYYVIDKAFQHCEKLISEYSFTGVMSINFSASQLKNPDFSSFIRTQLNQYSVPAHQVELEITETCIVDNSALAAELLKELKELGVKLSLDDFGTGYTAFKQLLDFPVDTIKVDRSFISVIDEHSNKNEKAIVKMLSELATLYNIDSVAEGVETQAQLDYVKSIGFNRVQGYFLSRPLEWQEFIQYCVENNESDCLTSTVLTR
jgi:diguanylate cyclase (GGDEF)-like protein